MCQNQQNLTSSRSTKHAIPLIWRDDAPACLHHPTRNVPVTPQRLNLGKSSKVGPARVIFIFDHCMAKPHASESKKMTVKTRHPLGTVSKEATMTPIILGPTGLGTRYTKGTKHTTGVVFDLRGHATLQGNPRFQRFRHHPWSANAYGAAAGCSVNQGLTAWGAMSC